VPPDRQNDYDKTKTVPIARSGYPNKFSAFERLPMFRLFFRH
jgi:hypothetical protein